MMDDRAFYCLSYLLFCLAIIAAFGVTVWRMNRRPPRE